MHEGHRERLKRRFFATGLLGFAPHEVLELLLTFAIPQKDVNPIAHALIAEFGSLSAVLNASPEALQRVSGVGANSAALLSLMPQLLGYYQRDAMRERTPLRNLMQAGAYCRTLFYGQKSEQFYLICLNSQGELIAPTLLHEGTVDETVIYPRHVVATALRHNAASVLLTHNHPGGSLTPSRGDQEATRIVTEALAAVQIRVIDHIIVSDAGVASMAQARMLPSQQLIEEDAFDVQITEPSGEMRRRVKVGEEYAEAYGQFDGYDGCGEYDGFEET